jgi:hypothetical protein
VVLSDSPASDVDRDRGILSPADRKYLGSDKSGYTRQAQHQRERTIRARVRNAILDFTLLFEHWDETERENVLGTGTAGPIGEGIADFFAMVHIEARQPGMKNLLLRGVTRGEQQLANSDLYDVRVEYDVEPVGVLNFEEAVEKFQSWKLHRLTDTEAQAIVKLLERSDAVGREDLEEMRQEWQDDIDEFAEEIREAKHQHRVASREKQQQKRDDG